MELQKRQLEQLQQIRETSLVPVDLLKMIEKGNKARKPIFGGGYMNGDDLIHMSLAWDMSGKTSDMVGSFMEWVNYEEKKPIVVEDKPKTVAKKKKVAVNG